MQINTAAGPVSVDSLGRTLMHEHLVIGFPGWESDTSVRNSSFQEMVSRCVDKIAELKAAGISSLLDPCPSDVGRDVPLMAEVASKAGFNIVFATGLYNQHNGGAPYWRSKFQFDPDADKRLADLFVAELTDGVRETGIKAGVIKVGTAAPPFNDYEKTIFRAAATASKATGAPITTHTDGVLGDEQLAYLTGLGVPAHKIVIGHSCGSADHDYHEAIVRGGAYIGFDRFGLEMIQPDTVRVAALRNLIQKGHGHQVVVSHDCVWCWRGQMFPPHVMEQMAKTHHELHFSRTITPMLKDVGVTAEQIDTLLIDNPRRYFAGEPLAPAGVKH